MRIAVDGRHLAAGRGVARYSSLLLTELQRGFGADEWSVVERRSRGWYAAGALFGRPAIGAGADVVWLPAPAPVAVARGVPYVVTVHDLSWVERPGDFTVYERVWHRAARVPRLLEHASLIIAVSSATADAVVSAGWGGGKVRVVRSGPGLGPPAAGDVVHPGGAERRPDGCFLVVGAIEPRKEPDVARRAHAIARERGLEADLVFASGVGDDELRTLYAGALAVVHPAHLEGFGFPPVEGLLHGAPAIVADLPVYDETIGAGALRFPAGDAEALAEAMLAVERDPQLRERLVRDGRAKVAELSWQRAAQETHAVLQEAARR